jgi:hypothetical protein
VGQLDAFQEGEELFLADFRLPTIADIRVSIKEIELDDGIWEVEGRDGSGRKIEIEVDAVRGEIVKIKRK